MLPCRAGVVALYLAAWLLIPQDGEDQAIAMAWMASHQNRSRRIPDRYPAWLERRLITMPAILALVLIAIVALTVISFTAHILFSPWLLVAIGILLWIKFRPRRSHQ